MTAQQITKPLQRAFLMDCQEAMKEFPDKYFDLAVVDPPYGLERFKKGIGKNDRHKVKSSSVFNNNPPTDRYFNELFRVSKNQIVFGANNFEMPPSEYFLIWDKAQTVSNFASAEYAWVSMGLKKPAKIFKYSIHLHNQSEKFHPTQKPIALYDWIFKHYAKQGDKILDTHLGSGSSRIAAWKHGLEFYGYEIDAEYFEAQEKRFKAATMQETIFSPSNISTNTYTQKPLDL